ncbi:MAG: hypothetical protein FD138_2141, partial [Planctomycetota bacterium]
MTLPNHFEKLATQCVANFIFRDCCFPFISSG